MALRRRIFIDVEDREFRRHDRQMRSYLRVSNTGFRVLGQNISGLGLTVKSALGSALVVAGALLARVLGSTVKEAVRFEEALVAVQRTTQLTDAELKILGERLLNLSGQLGQPKKDLADIAAIAGQLGIKGVQNISQFTETVAKLSRVSDLAPEKAAESLARVSTAFQIPISQAEKLGSVIVDLANNSTSSAKLLTDALVRVGSAGAKLGLTADQVAGLSSVLIDSGVRARRAGTGLRNVFIRMQTEAERMADVLGITKDQFNALVSQDALGALLKYLDALRNMPPNLAAIKIKETFGDQNFIQIQSLVAQTDLLNKTLARSAIAFENGSELSATFDRSMRSLSAKWAIFKERISAATTEMASKLIPVLDSVLTKLTTLTKRLDTPAERLLETLRTISNVDPKIIADVEIIVNRQALENQKRELKKAFEELEVVTGSSIENTFGAKLKALLKIRPLPETIGDVAQSFSTGFISEIEKKKIIDLTNEELESIREAAVAKIIEIKQSIGDVIQEGPEGAKVKLELELAEGIVASVDEARSLRDQLEVIDKTLDSIGTKSDELAKPPGSDDETDDDVDPIFSEQQREAALKFLKEVQRANELRATLSDKQKDALEQVFKIQDQIAKLEEASVTLGKDAVKDELDIAKRQLSQAQAALNAATEFAGAIRSAASEFEKIEPERLSDPTRDVFEDLTSEVKKSISDIIEETENGSKIAASALRKIPQAVIDDLDDLLDKPAEKTKLEVAADALEDFGDAFDSTLRLVNVFGDLSDGALEFASSIGSAIRGAEKLSKLLVENKGEISLFEGISAFAGIAGAGFSGFAALASSINAKHAQDRARYEEAKRLREQLRDNQRAIRDNTNALIGGERVGFGISEDQISSATSLIDSFQKEFGDELRGRSGRDGARGGRGSTIDDESLIEGFKSFLNDLEDIGIDGFNVANFLGVLESELAQGIRPELIIRGILDDIDEILAQTGDDLGGFGPSVEGAIASLRFFSQFLSEDVAAQLDRFISFLLDRVEDIPDDFRALLTEARGQDVTTEAGRERLNEIIAQVAAAIDSGNFDFGGLSPSEVEDILSQLQTLAGAAENGATDAGGQNGDVTLQIQRTITDVQANLVIQLLTAISYWTQRTAQQLGVESAVSLPEPYFVPNDPRPANSFSFGSSDIGTGSGDGSPVANTFNIEINATTIDRTLRELEDQVRQRLTKVY